MSIPKFESCTILHSPLTIILVKTKSLPTNMKLEPKGTSSFFKTVQLFTAVIFKLVEKGTFRQFLRKLRI